MRRHGRTNEGQEIKVLEMSKQKDKKYSYID